MMAVAALERMYLPEAHRFAFRIQGVAGKQSLEGTSHRYTAIALIGLAAEEPSVRGRVLGGETCAELCERLLADIGKNGNLGDVALTIWAARALGLDVDSAVWNALVALDPEHGDHPTVEIAWALAALVATGREPVDRSLARQLARRLRASFRPQSGVFPHRPDGAGSMRLRGHVACFADFVYPVHALSLYGTMVGDGDCLAAARRGADRMCELQGADGQWWWHFDVRTGRVIEEYPVYAVHQDSMAPMALFAAGLACGADYYPAVGRGLDWLDHAPEIGGSLVDRSTGVIWRKVGRREPGKLSRCIQAAASRLHPAARVPGLSRILRPGRVDYESRPYHMGWILYAWSPTGGVCHGSDLLATNHDARSRQLADSASV